MGFWKSVIRHTVGIAAEMTMQRDPYERHDTPPQIISQRRDECGHVVQQTVRADSHEQATRHLQGTTIQGNRSIVATRIARNTWRISIENWDTNQKGRGMTRSEGYDPNAWSEDHSDWKKRQK
jgi:hypothetical protein